MCLRQKLKIRLLLPISNFTAVDRENEQKYKNNKTYTYTSFLLRYSDLFINEFKYYCKYFIKVTDLLDTFS